jgi:hypothetical protein
VCDTLVHAYGDYAAVSCLAHLGCLGIFLPESFGDKLNLLMIIYSGLLFFECHLVNAILANLLFLFIWLQVPRTEKKKGKKERRLLVFFFRICNL